MGIRGRFDPDNLTEFEIGLFIGVLIGDGSFTGDRRTPVIAIKMHIHHRALFYWLLDRFGGECTGPTSTTVG